MASITGAKTYVNYGLETTWGTPVTADKSFGRNTILTPSDNNSIERIFQLGSQDIQEFIFKEYESTLSIDCNLNTPYWLYSVMGAVADAVVGSADDHTYTFADNPEPMTVEYGKDMGTDEVDTYEAFTPDTFSMRGSVTDGAVRCNLTGPYQTLVNDATLGSQASDSDNSFTFAHASVSKGGSPITRLQSFDFVTTRNVELVKQLGTRFGVEAIHKERFTELSLTGNFEAAATLMDVFYGAAGGPQEAPAESGDNLILNLTNGLADAAERTLAINLDDWVIPDQTLPTEQNQTILHTVTIWPRTMTSFVWTDATTNAPVPA